MDGLQGKSAWVTGASGGIGGETARRLAKAGCRVAAHGRDADATNAVVAQIHEAGGEAIAVLGEAVTEAARIADEVASAFGSIDILVNIAGTAPHFAFGEVTAANFDTMFHDNVLSAILCMQECHRHMPRNAGRIVNVASNLCYTPIPGLTPYAAAKSALITLTQGFARELGPDGIAVNAVAPGAVETAMTAWMTDEIRESISQSTPLGRIGQPDDVADVIVFLASPMARWITGRTILVDGGLI